MEREKIDCANFVLELRKLLGLSIERFCEDLGWNVKYYWKITAKGSEVSCDYMFGGLRQAINNDKFWFRKEKQIRALVEEFFLW